VAAAHAATARNGERSKQHAQHRFVPFARIARELATVEQILYATREGAATFDASLTDTERALAKSGASC